MRGTIAFCMLMGLIQVERGETDDAGDRDIYRNKVLEKARKNGIRGQRGGALPLLSIGTRLPL